jgi:hypothetical protein
MSVADATLLINLSAGDATYGYLTAKGLIEAHHAFVKEVILVVDTAKAQYSTFYDHAKRYAEPQYAEKISAILVAANQLKNEGLADRVIELKENDPAIKQLAKQYFKNRLKATHDFRGAPISAYMVGMAACNTKYVVRYDGDIIIHQTQGSDWILKGIEYLENDKTLIAASPNPAPPALNASTPTGYADISWFSTRCLLLNKDLLMQQRPLLDLKYLPELTLRKLLKRTYPPAFETVITNRLARKKLNNRYLSNEEAWFIHPEDKGELFLKLLPGIIASSRAGKYPSEQGGKEMLQSEAWNEFLNEEH